ncbi:MAG: phasin family protein [Rhodospirillaceae bacterium]
MYSNIFSIYEQVGATTRAKNETLMARAAFVTGVVEQGYRLWLTLLTTEIGEAVQAAKELSTCTSPNDVAELQRAYFTQASTRAITSLQGTIDIANFLVKNLQDNMAAATPGAITVPSVAPATLQVTAPAPIAAAPAVAAPAVAAIGVSESAMAAAPADGGAAKAVNKAAPIKAPKR